MSWSDIKLSTCGIKNLECYCQTNLLCGTITNFQEYIFWDVKPCNLIVHRRFKGTNFLHLEYSSDSCPSLYNSIKIRKVLVFLLPALFQNMFWPDWPSSVIKGVFKESALLSF
jgi:hypothetical protein